MCRLTPGSGRQDLPEPPADVYTPPLARERRISSTPTASAAAFILRSGSPSRHRYPSACYRPLGSRPAQRAEGQRLPEAYFEQQLSWLATSEVDMVTAVRGLLRDPRPCLFGDVHGMIVEDYLDRRMSWISGVQELEKFDASRRGHAELDATPDLDAGDPQELAQQYKALADRMPWLNVFGGCCGTDLRHVTEVVRLLKRPRTTSAPELAGARLINATLRLHTRPLWLGAANLALSFR